MIENMATKDWSTCDWFSASDSICSLARTLNRAATIRRIPAKPSSASETEMYESRVRSPLLPSSKITPEMPSKIVLMESRVTETAAPVRPPITRCNTANPEIIAMMNANQTTNSQLVFSWLDLKLSTTSMAPKPFKIVPINWVRGLVATRSPRVKTTATASKYAPACSTLSAGTLEFHQPSK